MIPPPACQGGAAIAETNYVYLLMSEKSGEFYLGWTTDLERRLDEHNSGKSHYTKSRGPWKLLTCEVYPNSQAAKARERILKRNPRMLFLFQKRALLQVNGTAVGGPRQVVG